MSEDIIVQFHMDTSTDNEVTKIHSPFDDRGKAADKISDLLLDTANSSSAMMQVRDAETGDMIFVNTMKLAKVVVRKA